MAFKERIENHPIPCLLGLVLIGLISGFGTYEGMPGASELEVIPRSEVAALRQASDESEGHSPRPAQGESPGAAERREEAPKPAVATLCTAEERVIFSCSTMEAKVVSVCSSSELTKAAGYVQYRFGFVGEEPELIYPATREHPKEYFQAGRMTYSGGGGAYLKFTSGQHAYVVFTGIGKGWESEGVVVSKSGEQVSYDPCDGPWRSEIGPEWFEQADLDQDPDQADFEIPLPSGAGR